MLESFAIFQESCVCLFCWKVSSSDVHKFCCKAEIGMGHIFLLSLLQPAASHPCCYGCFYGWGSGFTSELSGHWIPFSRSSEVFWVWITLKLFYAVQFYWKAGSSILKILFMSFISLKHLTQKQGKENKAEHPKI